MTTFIALLRAVNVGGRSLAMSELRHSLSEMGLGNVRTYVQSGNALFDADGGAAQEHAAAIAVRIERDLGPRVAVLVLTAAEMLAVVTSNPFVAAGGGDGPSGEKALHVTFLFPGDSDFGEASSEAFSAVYRQAFERLELPAEEDERAAFVGAPTLTTPVVYLELPRGYGRTKLNNAFFERKLGAAATTRNWRTVRALAELVSAC
jgi:uncharacterized protein (DUF1697 family)